MGQTLQSPYPAEIDHRRKNYHLLSLQLTQIPKNMKPAVLGDLLVAAPQEPLHAAQYTLDARGEPKIEDYPVGITAIDGDRTYVTNLDFNTKQIGAAVYDGDSQLVGFLAAPRSDADRKLIVIPVVYADPLVPHVRIAKIAQMVHDIIPAKADPKAIRAMLEQMEAFVQDAQSYDYEVTSNSSNGMIALKFQRMLDGEPRLTAMTISVDYLNAGKAPVRKTWTSTLPIEPAAAKRGGELLLKEVYSECYYQNNGALTTDDHIDTMEVHFIPLIGDQPLGDGQTRPIKAECAMKPGP